MIASITYNDRNFKIDLSRPIHICTPIHDGPEQLRCWGVDPVRMTAVEGPNGPYLVKAGAPVNFRNIFFNPHGHGTHTECVGHIAKEIHSVHDVLRRSFFTARLVSLKPIERSAIDGQKDHVITRAALHALLGEQGPEALVLRTLPNDATKVRSDLSGTNPPYLEASACAYLREIGVQHLLLDLPSVDRELDDGKLAGHHAFWDHPNSTDLKRTITELIYVPTEVHDGEFLLELQMAGFMNDASPSRPVLYELIS